MSEAPSREGVTVALDADDSLPSVVPSSPARKTLAGTRLGRYLIVEHVGAGGMGDVYRAYDTKLKREVALKLLKTVQKRALGDAATRLMREAQAMAQLSHPNVLPVFDIGEHEGTTFLAMEFAEGQTLSQWAHASDRSLEDLLHVHDQAGLGLAAAHARGFVHRDFKPTNVMIGTDGRVRVMDFGLVRLDEEQPRAVPTDVDINDLDVLSTELTEHGSVVGTPYYMAPEQHKGDPCTPKADQYAFCVALFAMLYDAFPFPQRSLHDLVRAKKKNEITYPTSAPRQVPDRIRQALVRGLAANPDDRWPDMAALLAALAPPQRSKLLTTGALITVFGLGIGGAYLVGSTGKDGPCSADAPLADVWNPQRAQRLRSTLSGATDYGASVETTMLLLDAWANAWAREYVDTCNLGRSQPALVESRTACLERHRIQARATIDRVFETTSPKQAEGARRAAEALPAPRDCSAEGKLDLSPEAKKAVAAIDADLATLRADIFLRDSANVLGRADDIRERARALEYPPLDLRVATVHGRALLMHGQVQEAANVLESAYFTALRTRDPQQAANFAVHLIGLHGYDLDNPHKGLEWSRHAEAWVTEDDSIWGEFLLERARARFSRGNLEQALADARAARIALEADRGQRASAVELAVRVSANSLAQLGRFEEASVTYEECIELASKIYGEENPELATVLVNYGASKFFEGEYDDAAAILRRAEELFRAVDPNHLGLLDVYSNLGAVLAQHDQLEESLLLFARAVDIVEHNGGDATNLINPLLNVAATHVELGQYDETLTTIDRVQALDVPDLGSRTWRVHKLRARALVGLKRHEEALLAWQSGLRAVEQTPVPSPKLIVDFRISLADAYDAKGDATEARHQRTLALALAKANPDTVPADRLESLERSDLEGE